MLKAIKYLLLVLNKMTSTSILISCLILLSSFSLTNISPNSYLKSQINTVVIDAGHGGKDPGCHGVNTNEKDVALAIALKVGTYIKQYLPNVKVIFTRKTDVFVELHERAAIANRNKADFFISIHCNSNVSPRPYGTETYVMGLHKTEANLSVAKRENEVILQEDNAADQYEGFDPNKPESHIIFSMYQNAYLEQSIQLASNIESQFKHRAGRKSRGVHQAGFLVLYRTSMPSVLVETGFLSNTTEEKYLKSEPGQDYLSSAIFRAFRDYKYAIDGKSEKQTSNEKTEINNEEPEVQTDTIASITKEAIPNKEDSKKIINKIDSSTLAINEAEPETTAITIENNIKEATNESPILYTENKLNYRVQFAILSEEPDPNLEKYRILKGKISTEHYNQHFKKYMLGSYNKLATAIISQDHLRANGFEGAFVVAYLGNKRISLPEAKKIENQIGQ